MTDHVHDTAVLVAASESPPETLARLRRDLAEAADAQGLVDVAYRTIDTRIGRLLLAATARGLVRVAFEKEDFATVLTVLAQRLSPRVVAAPQRLDEAAREVDEYLAGGRRHFDLRLDFALSTGFRQQVQRHLSTIDYGFTRSYGEIAVEIGNAKAVRAVGTACATNPLPVVVPCHRVLRSDGSVGGYLGGPQVKAALLEMERG